MAPTDFDDRMAVLSPHVFEGVPLTSGRRAAGAANHAPVGPWPGGVGSSRPGRSSGEFALVLRRESVAAKEMWQADHTELDLLVLDEHGKRARPWLTVVLDDHSRAVAHYPVFFGAPT